jgi:hypothetical protein
VFIQLGVKRSHAVHDGPSDRTVSLQEAVDHEIDASEQVVTEYINSKCLPQANHWRRYSGNKMKR